MAVRAEMDSDAQDLGLIMDLAFGQSPFAQAIHDKDLLCLAINDRMCQMFGITAGDLRGRRLTDVLQGGQYDAMERFMHEAFRSGKALHREAYRQVPGQAHEHAWSVVASPLTDPGGQTRAVWVGVLDITEQHWARRRLSLLNDASTHIGTTLDVMTTAQELAEFAVPRLADLVVVDLVDDLLSGNEPAAGPLTGKVTLRRAGQQSILHGVPETVVKPGGTETHPESSPPARVLATGTSVVSGMDDPAYIEWIDYNPARAKAIRKFGLNSMMCVPIRARGVTLGIAVFYREQRQEPFKRDDVLLAEELTARAAVSLDNARRYDSERSSAVALQRFLLPRRLPRSS
ncbi:MAG TPA: GAF domain-containing protein, partial [Trebonia sp.]|nr:GAF domain-containing protein [Trebonia sp.]